MKDIYKNPILYFVAVPVLLAIWPLVVWTVSLPDTAEKYKTEKAEHTKAVKIMEQILTLDPERLDFANEKTGSSEFDYTIAVERVASSCGISSQDYSISSGMIVSSGGQKNQSAKIVLKTVDITKFAKFLSTIKLRWSNLQCEKVKLTKKKGLPDAWKVDLDFKYYF